MMTNESIADFIHRLSDEEFDLLRIAIQKREHESELDSIALMKLPIAERHRIMEDQAKAAAAEWESGDIIEWSGDIVEEY